mmetsp:Transcript_28695/g.71476  ORF Transcript_28695/g.71476 Transcript_28695/m.71476 type:complete len:118 (-) Transcript_28695:125-478(-)
MKSSLFIMLHALFIIQTMLPASGKQPGRCWRHYSSPVHLSIQTGEEALCYAADQFLWPPICAQHWPMWNRSCLTLQIGFLRIEMSRIYSCEASACLRRMATNDVGDAWLKLLLHSST